MLKQTIAGEIIALHEFLAGWLNGTLSNDDTLFAQHLESRLVPGFINVQPSGAVLERAHLLRQIRGGYGLSPDFNIAIRNVVVRKEFGEGLTLATYEEYQRGAKNSAPRNARLSSVLMRPRDGMADWYSIHETWLPDDKHAAQHFDF